MLSTRFSRLVVTVLVAALMAALVPVLHHAEAVGASSIAYGQTVTGQINNQNYFEVWQFQGTKGDHVQIAMRGDGKLDSYLGLLDGTSQNVLIEDDDSGGNMDAYIETTLPATDSYIIVATRNGFDSGSSTGQYQLILKGGAGPQANVQTVSNPGTTTQPQQVSPGVYLMGELPMSTQMPGTISSNSYAQIYPIQLQKGTDLLVAMFADKSSLDCYLIFADSQGNLLTEDDNSGSQVQGSRTDSFLRLTIPKTDTYLIGATRAGMDQGTTTGNYVLIATTPQAQNTPSQPQPEPQQNQPPAGVEQMSAVSAGDTVSGTISAKSFVHLYPFSGQAGEQITITMSGTSGGLDAYLGIIDPKQNVIAEDNDSGGGTNAQISIRLPDSGTYYIVATRSGIDQGSTQGDYTLTVIDGAPAAPAGVTGSGGFGGLPGRAFPIEGSTFYLRGFGRSENPAKATPLESFLQSGQTEQLPGRSFNIDTGQSFFLTGFGRSTDPAKSSELQTYLSGYLGH